MKISKYTFLFDVVNSEFYIYSTLSNALVEIDENSYIFLTKAKNDKLNVDAIEVGDELYNILVIKKFITENDIDSFLFYKSFLTVQRTDKSQMHLTIAPTMDCCFSCHYCFETNKKKNYMSEEVMDSIIKYLNSLESKPKLKLTWFGGEPLMALSEMENFYTKLANEYEKPIESNVITTGFHINEESIKVMQKINIRQIQVTLDGMKNTHNEIKFISTCADPFSKVLDNIELLLKKSNIHVVFRINLTKKNAHEYVELYTYLMNRFKHIRKFGIAPAFVMDRGDSDTSNRTLFYNSQEISKFILELYEKYGIHSPFLKYPSKAFRECAIRNVMSISFDPEGYAYKCWEIIGNKEYAIGKLDKVGNLKNTNEIIFNRHLYGADPIESLTCSECAYLPLCTGGCPIQRIENLYEGKNNCCCTFYKGHLENYLKIHLKLIKNRFLNT